MRGWPIYDEQQIADVCTVLRSGEVNAWTGSHVRAFEQAYERYLGMRHAIAVANGTVALELALHAIGLQPGDEVIVTPRSFIASASCVVMAGGRAVFADVDEESQNITADTIAPCLSKRTKGIIAVHLAGWPCDMHAINALAADNGLWVIEDCAQAHGASIAGSPVGTFGEIAVFSFCQDKIITTGGEGGLIALNDEDMWRRAWSRKDHGKSLDAVFNTDHPPGFRWLHQSIGTNWRMTSIQAVLGTAQLAALARSHDIRAANAAVLHEATKDLPALRTPLPPPDVVHAWYRFYCFVRPEMLREGWGRDRIVAEINGQGIPCFSGSCPEIYRERAFIDLGMVPQQCLPVARVLGETSLAFLVDPSFDQQSMRSTAEIVRQVVKTASR